MKLLDRTFELLDASTETQRSIANGAGVDFEWLAKFVQRRIPNPGVNRVQAVHDYLSSRVDRMSA